MKQHRVGGVIVLATFGFLLSGCSSPTPAGPSSPTALPSSAASPVSNVEGTFATWNDGNVATTYNPTLVPVGAKAQAVVTVEGDTTETNLTVNGLVSARHYGAHAHVKPCGADGAAAGPHYQDQIDPVVPSVDPAFANKANEIWLDFETDQSGNASVESTVSWKARAEGARSITIHEMHTMTEPGKAGTAGSRLACINVDFAPVPG